MSNKRGGYILIEALIAIAGLLALMAILVNDNQQRLDKVQSDLRQTRAEACADAAVQQALAVLSTTNEGLVTLNDTWAQLGGTAGDEEFDFPDKTSFRMQVVDACSLINLNYATQAQLQLLPLDQDQVDSFLDWTSTGENARVDGAKDTFYNALPTPYNAKLGALTTVNELMLVDNWTAQTLYLPPTDSTTLPLATDVDGNVLPLAALFTVDSGSPNQSATGTPLINISGRLTAATATRLRNLGINGGIINRLENPRLGSPPITSFTTLFDLPGMNSTQEQLLLNNVTFSAATRVPGTINVNTASLPVLESIPQLPTALASAIVAQQPGGYTSLGEFASESGLSPVTLGRIISNFSVSSDTWIVRAYGESGGEGQAEEAVVGFRNNQLQIISVNRLHAPSIPSWWGWDATTSSIQQAGVTQ